MQINLGILKTKTIKSVLTFWAIVYIYLTYKDKNKHKNTNWQPVTYEFLFDR